MRTLLLFALLLCALPLGAQWQLQISGTTANLYAAQIVTAGTHVAGGDGVFLRTDNGGLTWTNLPILNTLNQPITGVEIHALHFFDASTGVAVGSISQVNQLILRTTDGGQHWTVVANQPVSGAPPGGLLDLSFTDNLTGYTCGTGGRIRKTTDGGQTWSALPNTGNYYTFNGIDFPTANTGFAVGYGPANDNVIVKLTNGGNNIDVLASGGDGVYDVDFTNTLNGYVSEPRSVFRFLNGQTIGEVLYTPDTLGPKRLHFIDNQTGFGLTDQTVRLTVNGGKFWEESALPAGGPWNSFSWSPLGDAGLVVGQNGRIAKTQSGGAPYVPMAIFSSDRLYYCKDSTITFTHPADPGLYNAFWSVDGQLIGTGQSVTFTPNAYNTAYAVSLVLDNGTFSDTFTLNIKTEPKLDFAFGDASVSFNSPGCAPTWVQIRVDNPAIGVYYNYSIGGVPSVQTQVSFDGQPLLWQTPELSDTTDIRIFGTLYGICTILQKADTVTAYLAPYPNTQLSWTTSDSAICVSSVIQVSIEGSEAGMQYQLMNPQNDPVSDWYAGNGGTLVFPTQSLYQSGYYYVKARNVYGCFQNLVDYRHLAVDPFYFNPYFGDNVAVVGSPYLAYVDSLGLATGIWNFGPNATPPTSTGFSALVAFDSAGIFPYAFQYQSQGACNGNIGQEIEVIPLAPALDLENCVSAELEPYAWQYRYNSPYVFDHHIDRFGNQWLTGYETDESVWFQPNNFFLTKLDPQGNLLWHRQASMNDQGMGGYYRASYGLGIDSDTLGNAYLCGGFSSDQVVLLGESLTCGIPSNYNYGQGFVYKLNAQGEVVWKIQITAPFQLFTGFCAPADIAFVDNDHIYISIAAVGGWKGDFPDGTVQQFTNPEAEAWLLVVNAEGQFVKTQPIGLVSNQGSTMINAYYPPTPTLEGVKATAWGPRIKPAPNGRLMVSGTFYSGNSLSFGQYVVTPLASGGFAGYNHFLAKLHVESGIWENAQCTHGVSGSFATPALYNNPDLVRPAWDVDENGTTWIAFGANPPVFGTTDVALRVRIGLDVIDTTTNTSYLLRYDAGGNRTLLNRNTRMFTADLLCLSGGRAVLFGNFMQTAGFRDPGGLFHGAGSAGLNDVFLAEVGSDGALRGLRTFANAANDVPLRLSNLRCGSFASLRVGNLDAWFGAPTPEPYVMELHGCTSDCPPAVVLLIAPLTMCGNGTGSFIIAASPALNLQWQHQENGTWVDLVDDAVYSGAQSANLTLTYPPAATNNTFYRCRVTGFGFDTLYTNPAQLTLLPISVITQQPMDATVSTGQTAQFFVQASGSGNQYRWQRYVDGAGLDWFDIYDNSDQSGTGSTNLKIFQPQLFDQDLYRCRVTRPNGCVTVSQSAKLNFVTAAFEPGRDNALAVSPNPFADVLNVAFAAPVYGEATVTLYGSTGAVAAGTHATLSGTAWTWHGLNLPAGMYVLEIRTADGIFTAKVAK